MRRFDLRIELDASNQATPAMVNLRLPGGEEVSATFQHAFATGRLLKADGASVELSSKEYSYLELCEADVNAVIEEARAGKPEYMP